MDAIGWSNLCNSIVSLVVLTIGHLVIIVSKIRGQSERAARVKRRKCIFLNVTYTIKRRKFYLPPDWRHRGHDFP